MNKTGLYTLFTIFAVALLLPLLGTSAHAALQPNIIVTGFKVVDGQAAVGKTFTLELTLENTEPSACAQAITTSVQSGPPFIMDGVSTLPAGGLCAGTTKTVDFPMKVDPTATGGFYQLTVTNQFETSLLSQFSSTSVLNVFVAGTPDLTASVTDSSPIDVYPGDTATVTVNYQNDGGFDAQAVTADVAVDAPLVAKWADSFAALGTIAARQSKTAQVTIEVPKDAAAKDYPMTVTIHYLDENLTQRTVTQTLTFHVKAKALFETTDAGSDALYANYNSRMVRLLVKNTGTDTAYELKLKMLPQYPFSTDGSVRYIGSLAPGETAPVDFTVDIDKDGTPGTYGLTMLVDYQDAQGKNLQDDTTVVRLTVLQKSFFRAVFIDYWPFWIAGLVIVLLVARKRMKGKKK